MAQSSRQWLGPREGTKDVRVPLIEKRSLPKTELSQQKRQKRLKNFDDNEGNTYQDYYEVNYHNHFLSPQENRKNLKSPKQSKRFRIFGRPLPKISSSTRLDESSRDYDYLTESEMPGETAKRKRHMKREMEKQAKKAYIKTRYSTEGASNHESESMQMKMRQRLRVQLDNDEYGMNMLPERPSGTPQQNVYTSNWHPIDYQNASRPKTHEPQTIRVYENTSNPSQNLALYTKEEHGKATIQQRYSVYSQQEMQSSQVVNRADSLRQKILKEEQQERQSKVDVSKIQPINLFDVQRVNESQYSLRKSQPEKGIQPQNSNIRFQVLQSAASYKRQSNSNSHLSQYQPPKDVIFQQKPVIVNNSGHHQKEPSDTATARFAAGFGRASIQSNARAPIFEAIAQQYHSTMKRFPSGSIIRTPDFSQSSSGQQYYSGMQQLANMRKAEFLNPQGQISVNQMISNIPSNSFADTPAFPYDYYEVHPQQASNFEQSAIQSQRNDSKIAQEEANPPTIVVTEPDKPRTGSSSSVNTPSERRKERPRMDPSQTSINNGIEQQPSSIPALHSNLHYARKNQQNLKSVTSIPTVSITKLPPEPSKNLGNSISNNNSQLTEHMETSDKLAEYLQILDQFAANIVQFDKITNQNGGSDGIVNFYLYKRFLKQKRRLEDCVKGGHNLFKDIDFLEITDSELHLFRQNPQNQSILEMLEEDNGNVLNSIQEMLQYFKKKFKIFPKANLNLQQDFQYETIYYLNKEIENIEKRNANPRISMKKLKDNQLRKAFLYESLFVIEFFNGRFIKDYQIYDQIEDLTAYFNLNKPTYDKEVTKYLMRR